MSWLTLLAIILAVGVVSTVSFIGSFLLVIRKEVFSLDPMLALSSGAMIGGGLLHLMPEAVEELGTSAFSLTTGGILLFFVVEKILRWHHCHQGHCETHTIGPMNLIGDGIHNFIDGIIVAAAFMTDISLGIATTLAVLLHEIPQEIGDFGVLLYSGYQPRKALFLNFLSALGAFFGAMLVLLTAQAGAAFTPYLLPIAAGGFLYIAGTDLFPELQKAYDPRQSIVQTVILFGGVIVMAALKTLGG